MLSSLFRRFLPLPDTFAAELLVVVTLTFKNRRNLALLVTICMVHSTTLRLLGNFRWKRSYYFDKICRKSFRTSWEISSVKLSPWSNHENSSTIPFLNTSGMSKKKFDDFKKKKDNLFNSFLCQKFKNFAIYFHSIIHFNHLNMFQIFYLIFRTKKSVRFTPTHVIHNFFAGAKNHLILRCSLLTLIERPKSKWFFNSSILSWISKHLNRKCSVFSGVSSSILDSVALMRSIIPFS